MSDQDIKKASPHVTQREALIQAIDEMKASLERISRLLRKP